MANSVFGSLRRASSLLKFSHSSPISLRSVVRSETPVCYHLKQFLPLEEGIPSWGYRKLSHGSVNLVISGGKTKFEVHEVEAPKKEKWQTKKRLKLRRMREKEKRKAANKNDPRRLGMKGKKNKQKFANAEERIKYKIEKAKIKRDMLIERLKRYEIPKVQGPVAKPDGLTGEERFYLKKMAQKSTNYLQVGRRGLFGGVVLNMHMHWKRHETVKVICKPCKPGQVHEYAQEIARLSGGIPIHIIGEDTIIFYRGKNYVQPKVMSPVDTLSKKKALEKSKYEQSLESVNRFIAICEKELELYYRHIALYGDPNDRNPLSILERPSRHSWVDGNCGLNEKKIFYARSELCETEDDLEDEDLLLSASDSEEDGILDFKGEDRETYHTSIMENARVGTSSGSLSMSKHSYHDNNPCLLSKETSTMTDFFFLANSTMTD